ncbi:PEP-CTERM sorting domain-containing protein [Nitrosovibrio sp. Nv17]|jgi:hypothetical protein|uniref:PEP-CTERM sorting domain-containing protein n=1 Tax=Nitrosovibrio sp. Nv17 TaxID=1855339 RepID=UPI002101B1B5|nr:PEP-CTERM sorting domain-containing protein [Nitrosovibrio sp. Nv17]
MKTNIKLFVVLSSALIGYTTSSMAVAANVTFTDSTFNLSDYSISKYQNSNIIDVTVSQTSSGNPGPALQIEIHFPRTFESVINASQYLINTTFRYDPSVQGEIDSISVSSDLQGVVIQNGASVPFNPVGGRNGGGLMLIKQGEQLYTNLLGAGSPVVGGNNFGFTHADGLKASDFGLITNLVTIQIDNTRHPSFTSGVLEFGFPMGLYGTNLFGFPETTGIVTIDNLSFTVSSVPEPETYAMLLAGLGLVGFVARRGKRSRKAMASR